MELWLIRHAKPVRIDGTTGQADPSLSPEGKEQAERFAEHWAKLGAGAVMSSTMTRAIETAEPLAEAIGVELVKSHEIVEFDAHLPSYIPIEELVQDPTAMAKALAEWTSPEAETERQAFREKVVGAIDAMADELAGEVETLAVVCHGGVINAYLSRVLHHPGTMIFEPAYTSASRAIYRDGHRQVVSMNETPHLEGLYQPSFRL